MNLGLWIILGIVGYAALFVVFRIAGLGASPTQERRPRWLLVLGVAGMAIGLILVVMASRPDR